jgi:hypothetical protein
MSGNPCVAISLGQLRLLGSTLEASPMFIGFLMGGVDAKLGLARQLRYRRFDVGEAG